MFSGRPSVTLSVRDSHGIMFPRYLKYLLTDFRQTFVTGASWDTGDTIAAEAHSTRRYRPNLGLFSNIKPVVI